MTKTKPDKLKILVVEDEMLLALDLEDILSDIGHEVVRTAASVDEALSCIREVQTCVDAAVVDANLAGKSARPVVDKLNEAGITVLVASGYGKEQLESLGFDYPSINKPYSAEGISTALRKARGD